MHYPVDLHTHSTCSDGRLAPAAVVARAAANGVRVLALTDHDTVDGLAEAGAAARAEGLTLVAGTELSVTWARRTLHVVGLGFDPGAPALTRALAANAAERERRAERIAHHLDRAGISGALDGARDEADGGVPGRMHFARHLVARGAVRRPADAFRRYLGRGRPAAVGSHWVSLEAGVAAIRDSGGVAVFAHPLRYGLTRSQCRQATAAFAAAGGGAVEVVCGGDGPGDRSASRALARAHGLLGSVGSDFHDPDFRWREIGRLDPPPVDVSPVWAMLPGAAEAAAPG